jgi:hypothetical protein
VSLGIAFKAPEGLVLAADSRVTLMAQQAAGPQQAAQLIPASFDNATKLLHVSGYDNIGAITFGAGAIGQGSEFRTAHSFLPELEAELMASKTKLTVEQFAAKMGTFYETRWKAVGMPVGGPGDEMNFTVAGFNSGETYGRIYTLAVPNHMAPAEQSPGNEFGLTFGGQAEITARLLLGFEGKLIDLAAAHLGLDAAKKSALAQHLQQNLAIGIPYQFLPLQDCVDLVVFLIRTTATLQQWQVGIRGVGGSIDVATITRTDGFRALKEKHIHAE